jgi:hypothetical protein
MELNVSGAGGVKLNWKGCSAALRTPNASHVPAPVVVFEPTSISLSYMKAGDVLNGELTLNNWGLVRADGLSFEFPADDGHFQYEFMKTIPSGATRAA